MKNRLYYRQGDGTWVNRGTMKPIALKKYSVMFTNTVQGHYDADTGEVKLADDPNIRTWVNESENPVT